MAGAAAAPANAWAARGGRSGAAGSEWRDQEAGQLQGALRTAEFWCRATAIYAAYKGAQLRAAALGALGRSREQVQAEVWVPQHTWAGQQMYDLSISLRGFYLKVRPGGRPLLQMLAAGG